jgi:alpha-tubulin suppressor-like RCC1 family protein
MSTNHGRIMIRARTAAWLRRMCLQRLSAASSRTLSAARSGAAERHVRRYLRTLPVLFAVMLAACSDSSAPQEPVPQPTPVAAVVVNPTTVALTVGETRTVEASPRDAQDRPLQRPVTWQTSDATIATVSSAGLITAVSGGAAVITATSEGKQATIAVQVAALPLELEISKDTLIFAGIAGIMTPPSQSADVVAKNGAVVGLIADVMYYEGGQAVGWLTATLTAADAPASVTITATTGALYPGTHRARVRVRSEIRAEVQPRIIEVVFIVQPGPQPDVSAADRHGCTLDAAGQVWCWGYNGSRQLGVGSLNPHEALPVLLPGGHRFLRLTTGELHACGIMIDGAATCWGTGYMGDGDGGVVGQGPRAVAGGHVWQQLAAGYRHTCGITMQQEVWCWGANGGAQLGDGTRTDQRQPVKVQTNLTFVRLTAGEEHTCGITADDEAYCWGRTAYGRLGVQSTSTDAERTPVRVGGGHKWSAIEAGRLHTCAVTTAGEAFCWGYNGNGQLGDETRTHRSTPTRVVTTARFASIAGGNYHSCAIATNGLAWCWGYRTHGGVGDGLKDGYALVPSRVANGTPFRSITTGNNHSCGISMNDDLFCWGYNALGAVGDGSTSDRYEPVRVTLQ